jgi:aminoglycoside phosphotransferase (APT) family kinase protein
LRTSELRPPAVVTASAVSTTPPVVRYLLDRGLLEVTSIVDGDLVVLDATRRNRNIKVFRSEGPSYLVKQGIDADGRATVAHEAAVYDLLGRSPERNGLARHLPRVFEFEPETGTLVLELFDRASDLRAHHARLARFPVGLGADLGRGLAHLHRIPLGGAGSIADPEGQMVGPAWTLSMHRPALRRFWEMSAASIALTRIVQQFDQLCVMLDDLIAGWRVETLVHNDLKAENCVVLAGKRGRGRVKLVDWEFAGPGDPYWDVGSVFGSYLSSWLYSVPILGSEFDDRSLALAGLPLERMQPAIRSFWFSYMAERGVAADEVTTALVRAVRYSGARLLQTAYEQTQSSQQLHSNVVGILQLAVNVMARPWEACGGLLGIPLPAFAQ